ncbi:MAG: glycosyltransferase [Anaerolineae bacterium]|nr:glycosyltransferase [Anaerolineae bacterium]
MKILFITASLPYPPQQGGALRTYGLLHGLHQAGHELTLLSFSDIPNTSDVNTPLHTFCTQIETVVTPNRTRNDRLRDVFFSHEPDIARRLYSEAFEIRLKKLTADNQFNLIQFEGIEVACYLPVVRKLGTRAKLVYDAFNAEAAMQYAIFEIDRRNPRRWLAAAYSLVQSRRISRFEDELCQQADLVIAVSSEDASILQQHSPKRTIPVVANGIFTDEYEGQNTELDLGEHALVFTGKMDYRPNVDAVQWFTEKILPQVKEATTDVNFYIVGQKPHANLEHLRDNSSVIVTGWVESVLPYLKSAAIYVAPLRMGSGTRLKILEAMAAGCAVVATTLAASGMQRETEMGMLIVDNPDQMAEAIIKLLNAPERRSKLGEAAHRYVKNHYDWSVLIPNLLSAYEAIPRG